MALDRTATLDALLEARMVAVIRAAGPEAAVGIGKALVQGGMQAIEVTFTTPDAAAAIRELCRLPGAIVGGGTIHDCREAEEAIAAGARYLVTPFQPVGLPAVAREGQAVSIMGGLTPTEIHAATLAGADIVKLFPIRSMGGHAHLADLRGPFPATRFLVSGGIEVAQVPAWLSAGASLVALGSPLIPDRFVSAADWAGLEAHVRQALTALQPQGMAAVG